MTGFFAVPVGDESEDDCSRRWAGVARVVGPRWAQLPSLTVGLLGVQLLWSVEMSYASPYLLSLGLSKSFMAIVFLAGPLSGLIVQPTIGILADNSKSRFGRRRPFILVGAVLCAFATLLLGFTRQFATVFTPLNSPSNDRLTIWLAILAIYCIDFSINVVQALDRALLVDILPPAKQPAGNAWAASMLAIGSVTGFFVSVGIVSERRTLLSIHSSGNLDLLQFFPFLGSTQLEVLSVIAAFLLCLTQAWVCFHVKERALLSSSCGPKGLRQELKELWKTLVTLPTNIRRICWIQFFAWLGWFPVLFYSTVYIGDLHKNSSLIPENGDAAVALDAEATRLGTRALFYSALVSLMANIVMPSFIVPQRARHPPSLQPKPKTWLERVRMHLASLWAFSHFIFAVCMVATSITSSVSSATLIISATGFCWAITQWAPFALLGEAILSHSASDDAGSTHLADTHSTRMFFSRDDVEQSADEETQQFFRADPDEEEEIFNGHPRVDEVDEHDPRPRGIGMENARARVSRFDIVTPSSYTEEGTVTSTIGSGTKLSGGLSTQAGAIIGIHNMFIVVPQFLVTGLASIIFAILDPEMSVSHAHHAGNMQRLDDGTATPASQDASRRLFTRSNDPTKTSPNSMAIIFQLGGVAAVVALVLSYRLAKELKRH